MRRASNEEEFTYAINDDEIEIELAPPFDIFLKTIKAKGRIVWGICVGLFGTIATGLICKTVIALKQIPEPTHNPGNDAKLFCKFAGIAGVSAASLITILGPSAFLSCAMMIKSAGGIGILKKLSDYELQEIDGKTILIKTQHAEA